MYSVVLAAMLTTTPATPQWGWGCHGCHGCHGCWSCHGCHGCYGCWGSCYGCYGGGGWGYGGYSYGNYAAAPGWPTWYGCYGGAFGCAGGGYACLGCYGCYGWGGYVAATPVLPARGGAGDRMPAATAGPAPATVVVQLPPDAKLYVEGKAVALDEQRSFTTPRLDAATPYTYTLKAQVVRNGRLFNATKDVEVRAGETTRVAFRDLEPAAAVAERNPAEAPPVSAHITVKLPQEAKLYVNDVLCPTRAFDTPKLDPERTYRYTLKAEFVRDGQQRTESKVVTFRAGQPVTVDFGRAADVRTASR